MEFERNKEMSEITFGIHWLSFTVHAPKMDAIAIYDLLFKAQFGELVDTEHGGKFFKEIYQSTFGFKVYMTPSKGNAEYFHFEIPGEACEHITWNYFFALGEYLRCNYPEKYHFTRIDLAFDHVPFTPNQIYDAIGQGQVRSLAKRETLQKISRPFEPKENGELGTCTVSFGVRSSERFLRVYDRRGFTRLEFEVKDRRADLIGNEVLTLLDESPIFPSMASHLMDFVEFQAPWWDEFIKGQARAWAKVTQAKEVTLSNLLQWLEKQVVPGLSVVADVLPEEYLISMLKRGRNRRGPKYNHLLKDFDA